MEVDRITSDESEGLFNDFIEEQLSDLTEDILNEGDLDRSDASGSDLIIEMDDITPPTFTYGDRGGGGGGGSGPGDEKGKLKFEVPFDRFMELVAEKLQLQLNALGDSNTRLSLSSIIKIYLCKLKMNTKKCLV